MTKIQKVYIYIFPIEDVKNSEECLMRIAMSYYRAIHSEPVEDKEIRQLFQIERTERGKPYFPMCPQIQFSISHSGSYWVCAMSGMRLGIDIQRHECLKDETQEEASRRFQRMANRFYHSIEAKYVEKKQVTHFFHVWTARESYVKYTGKGIDASFSDYCVIPKDETSWPQLSMEVPAVWQAEGVWFWERRFAEDYTLCVCTSYQGEYKIIDLTGKLSRNKESG